MKKIVCTALLLSTFMGMKTTLAADTTLTYDFTGILTDGGCTLSSPNGDGSLSVDLSFTTLRDLNESPGVSEAKDFSIEFIDCTPADVDTLKLKFEGTTEANMTGESDYFIEVTGANNDLVGLGILESDGTPLKFSSVNNGGAGTDLNGQTSLTLNFKAFIKATPDAIANQSVQAEPYTAQASIVVTYE